MADDGVRKKISVILDREDKVRLEAAAKEQGLKVSAFVRQLALNAIRQGRVYAQVAVKGGE